MIQIILDLIFLFFLGSCGWLLFKLLRLPIPALLGTVTLVGFLRVSGYPLPLSPDFLSPFIQIVLGLFVGSKVTRETVREWKTMLPSAAIIIAWALGVVFLLGLILSEFTYLDPVTAILSSSMGGLPEMTVIALSTNADIAVIIIIQTVRMLGTVVAFPFLLNLWMKKNGEKNEIEAMVHEEEENKTAAGLSGLISRLRYQKKSLERLASRDKGARDSFLSGLISAGKSILSLVIAGTGGLLFMQAGVPAGAMVGSMFFVAAASLLGLPIVSPAQKYFGFMLVGVGLMISDSFLPGTFGVLLTEDLLLPVVLSTVFIFASSLLVAYAIHRLVGWDFPTSFLAAAPGGFTVMTSLAVKYKKDSFRVSMLHLCRLLAIKSVVPFVFMFFF